MLFESSSPESDKGTTVIGGRDEEREYNLKIFNRLSGCLLSMIVVNSQIFVIYHICFCSLHFYNLFICFAV